MAAVVLALAASLGWGSSDFLAGLQTRSIRLLVVLATSQVCALGLLAIVMAMRGQGPADGDFIPLALLAGTAEAVGITALYRGLAIGSMGIVAPISATAVVGPVLVGLASGERLSPPEIAGIALAVIGVVLASRQRSEANTRVAAGIGSALVAAVGFGTFYVALRDASDQTDALWAVFTARATLVGLLLVAVVSLRPKFRITRHQVAALVAAGVLDTVGTTCYALATQRGLLSEVAVAASLYPLITMILARALIGERISLTQRSGTLMALLGVVVLTTY